MKTTAKAITTAALAAAMAIPVAVAIPTSADAQRFGVPSASYIRYHNCRVSGRSHWYCNLSDSERRAHDEKVRREEEARREAERRAAEERRRQKEREAQERRSRAAQEYLEYQLRSGDSCRFGGC